MNFHINVSGTRPVGRVEELVFVAGSPPRRTRIDTAELHHLEYRYDERIGGGYVALVYRLPDGDGA